MKKIILGALFMLTLASCKKTNIEPELYTVKYEADARYTLVYFNDNIWHGDYKNMAKLFGKWTYEYNAKKGDTAMLIAYVGTFSPAQVLTSSISVNGKIVKFTKRTLTVPDSWGLSDTLTYIIR